jgi:hypothetical protein
VVRTAQSLVRHGLAALAADQTAAGPDAAGADELPSPPSRKPRARGRPVAD